MLRRLDQTSAQGGFSLFELLVALAMTVLLMVGALGLFDAMNKLTRVQTNLSNVQQVLRVTQTDLVRHLRMAGRGGLAARLNSVLPVATSFRGVNLDALELRTNLGDNGSPQLVSSTAGAPNALQGSDMLIVRGVFNTPLYQIRQSHDLVLQDDSLTDVDPVSAVRGIVTVCANGDGIEQTVAPLTQLIADGEKEPMVMVNRVNQAQVVVVEADFGSTNSASFNDPTICPAAGPSNGVGVRIEFYIRRAGTSNPASADLDTYRLLSSDPSLVALPSTMRSAAQIGLLEEYRYYLREDPSGTANLERARMITGTESLWRNDLDSIQVFADNMLDMQVALGFDTSLGNCAGTDCSFDADLDNAGLDDLIYEASDGDDDDWLFNSSADDPTAAIWQVGAAITADVPDLHLIRLSLIGRTEGADPYYQAPDLQDLEDSDYGARDLNDWPETRFRRRQLQTVIELRNQL